MAQIIKLAWRLDYDTAFGLYDRRGQILRSIIQDKEFWDQAASGSIPDSFIASTMRPPEGRVLSVEPNSCNGTLEWWSGLEFSKVLSGREFKVINSIVDKTLELSEVRHLRRAGIRFFVVEQAPEGAGRFREKFMGLLDNSYTQAVTKCLGRISDQALVFEGLAEDGVHYRIQFGPTEDKNLQMTIPQIGTSDLEKLRLNNVFFDIDLYEMNFSFREHSLHRWASTKHQKAMDLISMFVKSDQEEFA